MGRFRKIAVATRGGQAESWHFGAAAVTTPEGQLVGRVGSEGVETFLRSAAKPFQALPLLLAGGIGRFDLSKGDLALICASHGGTPLHVRGAQRLLDKGGLEESDLRCGVHQPFDESSAAALQEAGETPCQLHNNCSGKHAGMLLACRLLELPIEGYLSVEHPLHSLILDEFCAVCRVDAGSVGVAIDGCGAPCFRTSLEVAARGYAALADPAASGLSEERTEALQAVAAAMTGEPEMVSGPGAFTTRLMEVTSGRVLAKEGAQGVYAVAVRGPVALGLVLKVADGADGPRPGVTLDLLRQLGSLSQYELGELEEFHSPRRFNRSGHPVGRIVSRVELSEVESIDREP